jgi:hypothetical protein
MRTITAKDCCFELNRFVAKTERRSDQFYYINRVKLPAPVASAPTLTVAVAIERQTVR